MELLLVFLIWTVSGQGKFTVFKQFLKKRGEKNLLSAL